MFIDELDVKTNMDLKIHKEIADFINKTVTKSNIIYFEELKTEMEELLSQEVIGDTVSDVGVGIELAISKIDEKIKELQEEKDGE